MNKFLDFFKTNWKFLLVGFFIFVVFWDKIKDFFSSIFNPTARDQASDNSGSDYLANQTPEVSKGVIVGSDGLEYFRYGSKKVRLTDANKARVVDYVNLVYSYLASNTNSLYDWFLDDKLHFYTSEVQATLNDYNRWCNRQETWLHYFGFIWLNLHTVQFVDYLRASMDAEGYDATKKYVTNLSLFYY